MHPVAGPPPSDRTPRLVVLDRGVPEHEQAFSLVAIVLGATWMVQRPPSRALTGLLPAGAVWPIVMMGMLAAVSGLVTLTAAWLPVRLRRYGLALRVERSGQLMQAAPVLVYAVGAARLGWLGLIGAAVFGGWGLACLRRAWRLRSQLRAIGKGAQ